LSRDFEGTRGRPCAPDPEACKVTCDGGHVFLGSIVFCTVAYFLARDMNGFGDTENWPL
jgi:hypothetical protein